MLFKCQNWSKGNPRHSARTSQPIGQTSTVIKRLLISPALAAPTSQYVLKRVLARAVPRTSKILLLCLSNTSSHALTRLRHGSYLYWSSICPTLSTSFIILNLKPTQLNTFLSTLSKVQDKACSIICLKLTSSLRLLVLALTYENF